ncbi:ATP-binding protein [Streptomyces sp. G45]|uniref:ATP-binding protein n=1 Tax=Streptomyces sp. G45 TaxID=3406627 RepID=UPI003C16D8AE
MTTPTTPRTPLLPTHTWSASYPMTPSAARLARLHTRRRLASWRWHGDIDDAVLVVSELVANAARHGRVPGRHAWLRLAVVEGGGLVVDVSDAVAGFPGFPGGAAGAMGEGGRGLIVVRQLAHDVSWFPRDGGGKTVRARLTGGGGGGDL